MALLGLGFSDAEEKVYQTGQLRQGKGPTVLTDVIPANDEEKEETAGDMTVKIKGRSGKFEYYHKTVDDARKVEVKFDDLAELNADGDEIDIDGHSIKNFAGQDFSFTPVQEKEYGNATFQCLTFESPVNTVGKLEIETCMCSEAGFAGPPGDEWYISAGNLKFNINFPKWDFCNPCTDRKGKEEIGEYLQFEIEIKGRSQNASKIGGGKGGKGGKGGFDLGAGAEVLLTSKYEAGAQEQFVMPEGFPAYKTKGNKQIFAFRFAKFVAPLIYDPVLGVDQNAPIPPLPSPPPAPTPEDAAISIGSPLASLVSLLAVARVL